MHKDPTKKWNELPYMATDDVIFNVLEGWMPEWHTLAISTVEAGKSVAQRKKEEAKLWVAQLVKKRHIEAIATKAQEAQDVVIAATEAQKVAKKEHEGQKSPSLEQEQEMDIETKEGGTDLQIGQHS